MLKFAQEIEHTPTELDAESKRALTLFRTADYAQDRDTTRALVALSEGPGADESTEVEISKDSLSRLAHALRDAGTPLTDDGIRLFKMEHGYSNATRLHPQVAHAYARHARRCSTRLEISPTEAGKLDIESRRALRILVTLGRNPVALRAVCRRLEVDTSKDRSVVSINRAASRALVDWAHRVGLGFTNDGMVRFARGAKAPQGKISNELVQYIAEAVMARGEPEHDYAHRAFNGHRLNKRTYTMLNRAQAELGDSVQLEVIKGSYLPSARGAHPHKGGGVIDVGVRDPSGTKLVKSLATLRRAGFAAWFRPREDRPHIHCVAIGDRDLSPAAAWQVKCFFEGFDGRSRMGKDPHSGLVAEPPKWTQVYGLRYLKPESKKSP